MVVDLNVGASVGYQQMGDGRFDFFVWGRGVCGRGFFC